MKLFGPFIRALRRAYAFFQPSWRVEGETPGGPAVYVVHHRNLSGPIRAVALLPREARVWALACFTSRRACFDQYYRYTFTRRFHWPRPLAWLTAGALCLVVPPLVRGVKAIPVHRGRSEILNTMRESAGALARGESLIVCPDVAYDDDSPGIGSIYTGFFKLEQLYHQATGEHLRFVPVYVSGHSRCLALGRPVRFPGLAPFRRERKQVAEALTGAINALGRRWGDIPAPYGDTEATPQPELVQ